MSSSPTRLSIKCNVQIDFHTRYPFPSGVSTYQDCTYGRSTEIEAQMRIIWGKLIPATNTLIHQNGQVVNTDKMLMCSRCHTWKYDSEFESDRTRKVRRGRGYYCKSCRANSRLLDGVIAMEVVRKTKAGKTKKKRR